MPSMSSFFGRSSSKTDKRRQIEEAERQNMMGDKDPFGDVCFWGSSDDDESNEKNTMSVKETYTDGIEPVIISIDETDHQSRNWMNQRRRKRQQQEQQKKQPKPLANFADENGEEDTDPTDEQKSRMIGFGDLTGSPSDLDFCCIPNSSVICVGSESATDEGEIEYVETRGGAVVARKAQGNSGKIRSISNKKNQKSDGYKDNNNNTSMLDSIRCLGPIRDRNESKGLTNYCFDPCSSNACPSKQGKFLERNRFYLLIATVCFLLIAIAGAIAYLVTQKKNIARNGQRPKINESNIFDYNDRESHIKNLLQSNPDPGWETEGSPQQQALQWLVNEDPGSSSMRGATAKQIQERFAAATLYFATGGPTTWGLSLNFLSESSICSWNNEEEKVLFGDSIGIFCGPAGSVTEINIVSNNLSGSLPYELNHFSDLVVLNMYYNDLTGSIPHLSGLIALEQLDLDGNKLSGKVPETLFNLPSILNLFLLYNKDLTGTIPEIGYFSKLAALSLMGCSFYGTIPKSLASLSTLRLLQLKDNAIEGTIPSELISLPYIETLGLDGNRLVGSIPRVMVSQDGSILKSLSLGSNFLEGPLPDGLEELTTLQFFYADDNMLTGTIPDEVMELRSLEQLWLQDNTLSGDISDFSSDSYKLTDIYLGSNEFAGNLHALLRSAPKSIERLDVSGNRRIGGYISNDIGDFDSMKYFNASSCSLQGILPSMPLSQLVKVQTFDISKNRVAGEIPTEIGSMVDLENLNLSNNDFSGYIPDQVADLVSLTSLDVSVNRDLDGDLTSTVCKTIGDNLFFSFADCSGNNPVRVDCECCTHCCTREGVCGPNNT